MLTSDLIDGFNFFYKEFWPDVNKAVFHTQPHRLSLKPNTVISTEAAHSFIVNSAVESPPYLPLQLHPD